ncbi:hypothetical protein K443DRAFT_424163 [Laccaria amethystina LaAM-08-1]|uniref:Uncharacterized protein n=1 Tax=Laccaria amethystina LaAM-08-1 TaxID=1095629 RepID=A0A0C9XGZ6_9AGAR|nr:hypothetical protein K443DRAFT_424163 [Laccaria amethystina LaAM-08-1]
MYYYYTSHRQFSHIFLQLNHHASITFPCNCLNLIIHTLISGEAYHLPQGLQGISLGVIQHPPVVYKFIVRLLHSFRSRQPMHLPLASFPFFLFNHPSLTTRIFFPTTMGSSRPPWRFLHKVYFILHFIVYFPFIPPCLPCQRPSASLFWYPLHTITVSNWYFQAFPSTLLSLFCVSNRCKTLVSYIHPVVVHKSLTTSDPEGPLLPSLFSVH